MHSAIQVRLRWHAVRSRDASWPIPFRLPASFRLRKGRARSSSIIRRFIVFHHKKHPSTMGALEITAFLSSLATGQRVSSAPAFRAGLSITR
ncbi:MAG: hypothetical protein EXQ55_02615 [Acidobacteria bacterium]|nr:hypothetical protein [Acidobacteriota bacterium]